MTKHLAALILLAASSLPAAAQMAMSMTSARGDHPMSRDASGTAWQPDATPHEGLHVHGDPWMLMAHGYVNVVHDRQSGRRGGSKTFAQSMLMGMADRDLGPGRLGLRAMVSLDPAFGKRGYPLLFQTGETADGATHLVDRQHPHDFLMELSASWSVQLGDAARAFVYAGLPGEPALGPPAFMHRWSGMRNPEAPLSHHWLDSTHITFGVVTLGVNRGPFQLEGSWFNGREPDQHRWNVETRRFDSWSARFTVNPTPALSMQASHGDLESPEQLEPEVRIKRTTVSATLHLKPFGSEWATTLAWGRNAKRGGHHGARTSPAWLAESALVRGRWTVFGRVEQVETDELFEEGEPLGGRAFEVRKFQLGTIYDVVRTPTVAWGWGASAATFATPDALKSVYGRRPWSLMLFLQGRL